GGDGVAIGLQQQRATGEDEREREDEAAALHGTLPLIEATIPVPAVGAAPTRIVDSSPLPGPMMTAISAATPSAAVAPSATSTQIAASSTRSASASSSARLGILGSCVSCQRSAVRRFHSSERLS